MDTSRQSGSHWVCRYVDGRGKAAYLHLLEAMANLEVATLYGRTSNPGVVHIGRAIGRRVRRIILRRDGPFLADELIPDG